MDEPLALITPTAKYYYHANHLYSVAALTNQAGAVVERYRYDAYGQRIVLAADGITTRTASNYGQQVGFTGRYLDRETGLWYFRTRYYSAPLGRFINRMPWRKDTRMERGRGADVGQPYSFVVLPNEWRSRFQSVFKKARVGQYIQDRHSLYDAFGGAPSNRVEPFSLWGQVYQPTPDTSVETGFLYVEGAYEKSFGTMGKISLTGSGTIFDSLYQAVDGQDPTLNLEVSLKYKVDNGVWRGSVSLGGESQPFESQNNLFVNATFTYRNESLGYFGPIGIRIKGYVCDDKDREDRGIVFTPIIGGVPIGQLNFQGQMYA